MLNQIQEFKPGELDGDDDAASFSVSQQFFRADHPRLEESAEDFNMEDQPNSSEQSD